MVNLPIFPPMDSSLPKFETSLVSLNKHMHLKYLQSNEFSKGFSTRDRVDKMKEFYPSTSFDYKQTRYAITKSKFSSGQNEWMIQVKKSQKVENVGSSSSSSSSQQANDRPLEKLDRILSMLLVYKKKQSNVLYDEDDVDLLKVVVSCAMYECGFTPVDDTEDARQKREYLKFLDVDFNISTSLRLLESLPNNKKNMLFKQPMDFAKLQAQQEFCRNHIPSARFCNKETLTDHPECSERCQDLFASAVEAIMLDQFKTLDTYHLQSQSILLHATPGLCIHLSNMQMYHLSPSYDVYFNFIGFKENDELLRMTPIESEQFLSHIGSGDWINKYCNHDFSTTIPKAWTIDANLANAIVKQLHTSHFLTVKQGSRFKECGVTILCNLHWVANFDNN